MNYCSSCGAPLSAVSTTTAIFIPDDPSLELKADELLQNVGDLATGAGVLIEKSGPDAGAQHFLTQNVVTVGRHPESDIFLDDITVSRRHAEFVNENGTYKVKDAGSLNGTYVNRERIEETSLRSGDEVQIGKFKLLFVSGRIQ